MPADGKDLVQTEDVEPAQSPAQEYVYGPAHPLGAIGVAVKSIGVFTKACLGLVEQVTLINWGVVICTHTPVVPAVILPGGQLGDNACGISVASADAITHMPSTNSTGGYESGWAPLQYGQSNDCSGYRFIDAATHMPVVPDVMSDAGQLTDDAGTWLCAVLACTHIPLIPAVPPMLDAGQSKIGTS